MQATSDIVGIISCTEKSNKGWGGGLGREREREGEAWVEVAKGGGGNEDFYISVNNKNKVGKKERKNHSGSLEAGTLKLCGKKVAFLLFDN